MITKNQYSVRFVIALLSSFLIFYIIQSLISQSSNLDRNKANPNYVDFIRVKEDDSLQERTRSIPEKPPTPKRPPTPKVELDELKPPPVAQFDFDMPDFSLPTDFSGAFLGSLENLGTGTSQLIPIVKVAPRCPRDAQINGINGSVRLLLNVNESGRVDSVQIKESKPLRTFDAEAIKAVRRWQFKPKTIDGVAYEQVGELLVEFSCNV
jgi:protein TonB